MNSDAAVADTWEDVLELARASPDPERTEMLLTAVLAAALALSPDSLHERRTGGYPPGVPKKATVRSSAQLLLDRTTVFQTTRSRARRSLAWTQLLRLPQQKVVTDLAPQGELSQALVNCEQAVAELGDDGDATDHAVIAIQLARCFRRLNRAQDAIDAIAPIQERNDLDIRGPRPDIVGDAPFLGQYFVQIIRFKNADILCNAYKDAGRLELSMRQVFIARECALQYAATDPVDYARTWILEGQIHRRRRDVRAMLRMERESRELVERFPDSLAAQRYSNVQESANASLFQDFSRATELRYIRLRNRIAEDLGRSLEDRPSIDDLLDCVRHYRQLNSKAGITWLGNIAWDISTAYIRAGETNDPRVRAYVAGLLDVAEQAWDGFAGNGASSLLYGRARLALRSGDKPTAELTADLVEASRTAYRWATAHNALIAAVRYGVAGSATVRERLDERIDQFAAETAYVAHAKTVGISAEWFWRASKAATDVDWARVEAEALVATRLLRVEGVSLAPESEATAWMAAADALVETNPLDRAERLRRLLRGIACVTDLTLTIATTADRQRISYKFQSLFADAADLAIATSDHAAADLIMEAARRDRVGLLLAELASNPDVAVEFRTAALAIQDAGSATVEQSGATPDDEAQKVDDERGVRGRSTLIAVDRAAAVKAAESVLGPLSALADPRHLDSATAVAVLTRRGARTRPTVVLQLLPIESAAELSSPWVNVLRRCTIAMPGKDLQQFTDRVRMPRLYLDLTAGGDETFEWRKNYTHLLIPPPLLDLLAATPTFEPIRLLIAPTGLFHIAFDALPVTSDTHVLDHALISIHGSLTSVLSLMDLDRQRHPTPALAVYDLALEHARPELDALVTALGGVRQISSHGDLAKEMTVDGAQPHSLLAMAVHGSADDQGWGQAKKLRDSDGNTVWVTAAQALGWKVPRLCVLASCNTPITTSDGIEVAGFPLSLMLGGATTVIGGLYNIDDKATSAIMSAFWRHLAAGRSALPALRQAKLDYLKLNPQHRDAWPELWAGLTVYGAPNS